ncbi:MAG: hypothetical protein EOO38_02995 [Cytophagaceae bacterium]|nr:MAG: hypothetical protein EOO38_02995 [Cytophagaceae bacterium]
MKRSKFTQEQAVGALKQAEAGAKVDELCRKHGVSSPTFYADGYQSRCQLTIGRRGAGMVALSCAVGVKSHR